VAVNLHATHYRFGINELAESTHGWHAALDANPAQGVIANDTTFLLRFTVQETGGTAAGNTDQQFQRNLNGAGWVDITTVSSVVKAVTTAVFANGADLTNRLTGTGTFESSGDGGTHDGLSGGIQNDIAASGNSETECALQIIGADVASGATIQFRLTSPDFTITNDVVPTIISQVESQTIAVGQSAETDSAQAVAWAPKRRLAGQVVETDLAQAVLRVKRVAVAQVSETELAQPIALRKVRTVGQVTETDLAEALFKRKVVVVGQPSEADMAQAIARVKGLLLGQALETDLAQSITEAGGGETVVPVGLSTETELAQPFSARKTAGIGQASETDSAQTVTGQLHRLVGQVTETDNAQPFAGRKTLAIGMVFEIDLALLVSTFGSNQPGYLQAEIVDLLVDGIVEAIVLVSPSEADILVGSVVAEVVGGRSG